MSDPRQAELFKADTSWFHVFRHMIESGDCAKMGPFATTVYMVIKAHTNFSTGRAFPSLETIVEKSGVSLAQVKRSLATLEQFDYLSKEKVGRNNVYRLREKVEILDQEGRPAAVATWDYLPNAIQEAQAQLRNFLMSGEMPDGKVIYIERLNMNIQVNYGGDGHMQTNNNGGPSTPPRRP